MTERITFSVTLLRDDALHLQEAANEGGLLLSEYAARCLASIAEDDRRAHFGKVFSDEVISLIENPGDTVPGHPKLHVVGVPAAPWPTSNPHTHGREFIDECMCPGCQDVRLEMEFQAVLDRTATKVRCDD
jgi:hypothetical protein